MALALKEIPHYLPGLDTTAEGAPAKEWDQLAARWSALQAGSLIRIYLTPVLDRHLLPPCGKRSPTLLSQSKPQFKEAESFEPQDSRSADADLDVEATRLMLQDEQASSAASAAMKAKIARLQAKADARVEKEREREVGPVQSTGQCFIKRCRGGGLMMDQLNRFSLLFLLLPTCLS